MRALLIALVIAGSMTACGSTPNTVSKIDVDGTECVKITTSAGGASIDCNWGAE